MSCGKSISDKKTSKVRFSNSAILSGIPQNGGILVLGHRLDDAHAFMIGLPDANINKELDLDKGPWEFFAIGWEGDSGTGNRQLTGANRCGYVGVIDLNLDNQNIVFNMNKVNCTIPIPGEADPITSIDYVEPSDPTKFKRVEVRTCLTIPVTPSATDCTSGNGEGLALSYQIEYFGGIEKDHIEVETESSLFSACKGIFDTPTLRIPVGDGNDSFLRPVLLTYTNATCSGQPIVYDFHDGDFNSTNSHPDKESLVDGIIVPAHTILFVEHNSNTPIL
jgi:hypothetical protein